MTESRPAWSRQFGRAAGRPITGAMFVVAAAVSIVWQLAAAPILSSKEAARVALAQRPIGDLLDDTRRLGLRPLWYLYEHAWIELFGAGDHSVHLSTAVIAIAVLPAAFLAGRAIGIDDFGALAVLAFVASPLMFAAGTGVGPDALLILLATLGVWAFAGSVRNGGPLAAVLLALVVAALMWTHQWSLFAAFAAGVAALVVATQDQGAQRRSGLLALGAVVAGALSILLWTTALLSVPSADGEVVQRLRPATVVTAALAAFHGGTQPVIFIGLVLVMIGVFGRGVDERFVILDFRMRRDVRLITLGLVAAFVAISVAGVGRLVSLPTQAFAPLLPPFVLLVAAGIARLQGRGRAVFAAVLLIGSTLSVVDLAAQDRTQLDEIVTEVSRQPDLPVVTCQPALGDALRREAPNRTGAVVDVASNPSVIESTRGPFFVVRGVDPDVADPCDRKVRALPSGTAVERVVEPDRDDSDEPLQLDLVRPVG